MLVSLLEESKLRGTYSKHATVIWNLKLEYDAFLLCFIIFGGCFHTDLIFNCSGLIRFTAAAKIEGAVWSDFKLCCLQLWNQNLQREQRCCSCSCPPLERSSHGYGKWFEMNQLSYDSSPQSQSQFSDGSQDLRGYRRAVFMKKDISWLTVGHYFIITPKFSRWTAGLLLSLLLVSNCVIENF